MNEGDPGAAASAASLLVDQADPFGAKVGKGCVDVGHRVGDVVHPFSVSGQKPADRRVISQRLQQLDEGAANRDHCFFHPLGLDRLPVQGLDAVLPFILGERRIQVGDGNADMVEIDQLHVAQRSEPTAQEGTESN